MSIYCQVHGYWFQEEVTACPFCERDNDAASLRAALTDRDRRIELMQEELRACDKGQVLLNGRIAELESRLALATAVVEAAEAAHPHVSHSSFCGYTEDGHPTAACTCERGKLRTALAEWRKGER